MHDILADFDFVKLFRYYIPGTCLSLGILWRFVYLLFFFVVCSFPGIVCRSCFLCAFFAHLCANLATYSPFFALFSLSITIRTKTGNIP